MAVPAAFPFLLEKLVSFDTTSHCPLRATLEWIAAWLREAGVEVWLQTTEDGERGNLLARVGPADPAGRGLTLCGHLDVVPALEPDWRHPPFRLHDDAERWSGRGTADMKGFLALALDLAARWARRDPAPELPLGLLLTHDEEVGSHGARRFAAASGLPPLPRHVLIGEPTRLRLLTRHKGHMRFRIELHGRPAHSGLPAAGVHALEPVGDIVTALTHLRRELEDERAKGAEDFPETPYVALNIARIQGGEAVNIIPEYGRVEVGLRPLPGTDLDALAARVVDTVRRAASGHRATCTCELEHTSPPFAAAAGSPLAGALGELCDDTGRHSAPFSSDAGFLAAAGYDCVLWGPGDIRDAHRANEFLEHTQVSRAASILEQLVTRACTGPGLDSGSREAAPGEER